MLTHQEASQVGESWDPLLPPISRSRPLRLPRASGTVAFAQALGPDKVLNGVQAPQALPWDWTSSLSLTSGSQPARDSDRGAWPLPALSSWRGLLDGPMPVWGLQPFLLTLSPWIFCKHPW